MAENNQQQNSGSELSIDSEEGQAAIFLERTNLYLNPYMPGSNPTQVLYDDFDDGVRSEEWVYEFSDGSNNGEGDFVSEHDGYLELNQNTTDHGGKAAYHFEEGVFSPVIEMNRLDHFSNEYARPSTDLYFVDTQGEVLQLRFKLQRSAWGGGL